jgi:hypothetical protein
MENSSLSPNEETNNCSLQLSKNYKKVLDCTVNEITQKYYELIIEYFKFIVENTQIKNLHILKFVIIRGLDTITNVFLHMIYFTKNTYLTYFHCQKSFYLFIEFIGQISHDEKMYLQLTSRDATTYVYKQTIFNLNSEFKTKPEEVDNVFREKLDIIKIYVQITQTFLLKIIHSNEIEINVEHLKNIEHLKNLSQKISQKLVFSQNKSNLILFEKIIEKFYQQINDKDTFLKINNLFLKKIIKNPEQIITAEKKINLEEFENKLNDSPEKFITWLITNK